MNHDLLAPRKWYPAYQVVAPTKVRQPRTLQLSASAFDRGLNRSTQQFDDIALPVFRSLASFWVAR